MVKILKAGGQAADGVSCEAIMPASSLSGLRTESDPIRVESQIGLCVCGNQTVSTGLRPDSEGRK
jgi:hypothetical protein